MLSIVWSRTARDDLQGLVRYLIATYQDVEFGRSFADEVFDRVEQQAMNPLVQHQHPDAPTDWFYLRHKRWLVFYRTNDIGIYVMRVIDASRDLPTHLS